MAEVEVPYRRGWTVSVAAVDPQQLVRLLIEAGWTPAGRRSGVYERLTWPGPDRRRSLLVPLDAGTGDYGYLMSAVLAELDDAASTGRAAQQVLAALAGKGDQ